MRTYWEIWQRETPAPENAETETLIAQKDLLSCIRDRRPLRTLNSMKTGCLIQDVRRVELKNLIAKRDGGSFFTGDLADEHVSPSVGDASLVIEGEEFAGNVVRHTGGQVIFESDRFEELAKKLS
jgi:hypothetical protein